MEMTNLENFFLGAASSLFAGGVAFLIGRLYGYIRDRDRIEKRRSIVGDWQCYRLLSEDSGEYVNFRLRIRFSFWYFWRGVFVDFKSPYIDGPPWRGEVVIYEHMMLCSFFDSKKSPLVILMTGSNLNLYSQFKIGIISGVLSQNGKIFCAPFVASKEALTKDGLGLVLAKNGTLSFGPDDAVRMVETLSDLPREARSS
jgi:hypothetical protein